MTDKQILFLIFVQSAINVSLIGLIWALRHECTRLHDIIVNNHKYNNEMFDLVSKRITNVLNLVVALSEHCKEEEKHE